MILHLVKDFDNKVLFTHELYIGMCINQFFKVGNVYLNYLGLVSRSDVKILDFIYTDDLFFIK